MHGFIAATGLEVCSLCQHGTHSVAQRMRRGRFDQDRPWGAHVRRRCLAIDYGSSGAQAHCTKARERRDLKMICDRSICARWGCFQQEGILMNVRDLIPWARNHRDLSPVRSESMSPVVSLHREMNRLFDDMFRGVDDSRMWGGRRGGWPKIDV